VLASQTRALGLDHPDTLIVRFNIAREMAARGDHVGAEKEFRDMLPIWSGSWAPITQTRWRPLSGSPNIHPWHETRLDAPLRLL
jgi:hypothetical protein